MALPTIDELLARVPKDDPRLAAPNVQTAIDMLKSGRVPMQALPVINKIVEAVLGPAMPEGYHFSNGGVLEKDTPAWKKAVIVAAAVGGPLALGFALPAAGTSAATTAGSTAAATGGSLLGKTASLIGAGSRIAGAFSDAQGQNRAADADYAADYDDREQRRAQLELERIRTDLDQRRYADDRFQTKGRNAIYGGYLSGVEDVNVQAPEGIPMGTVTGGLRPSAILGRRETGDALRRDAMRELLNPTQAGGFDGDGVAPVARPTFGSDASRQEVIDYVNGVFSTRGITPNPAMNGNPSTPDYYADRFAGEFNRDPNYLADKLAGAEEFVGKPGTGANRLPRLPSIAPSSVPRSRGKGENLLGGANLIGNAIPLIADILGGYQRTSPRPLPPTARRGGQTRSGIGNASFL